MPWNCVGHCFNDASSPKQTLLRKASDSSRVAALTCALSAGQLEEEISRNGWLTVDAQPEIIFDTPVELRYERALSLLGIDPRMLSQEAGHA